MITINKELNYGLLGKLVAERMIDRGTKKKPVSGGIAKMMVSEEWNHVSLHKDPADKLRILTIDSPETMILQGLAKAFIRKRPERRSNSVYLLYDDLYQKFLQGGTFRLLRYFPTWM